MEVSGFLAAGEVNSALIYVKARRGLSPRQAMAIILTSVAGVGMPLSAWISRSWIVSMASVECAALGLVIGGLAVQMLSKPATMKALSERGISHEQPVKIRLTHEVLIKEYGDMYMRIRWACVTDLYQTRKYWVFLAQHSAVIVPRRFFSTAIDEREFILEALSRMPEEAQARSPDAVRFTA